MSKKPINPFADDPPVIKTQTWLQKVKDQNIHNNKPKDSVKHEEIEDIPKEDSGLVVSDSLHQETSISFKNVPITSTTSSSSSSEDDEGHKLVTSTNTIVTPPPLPPKNKSARSLSPQPQIQAQPVSKPAPPPPISTRFASNVNYMRNETSPTTNSTDKIVEPSHHSSSQFSHSNPAAVVKSVRPVKQSSYREPSYDIPPSNANATITTTTATTAATTTTTTTTIHKSNSRSSHDKYIEETRSRSNEENKEATLSLNQHATASVVMDEENDDETAAGSYTAVMTRSPIHSTQRSVKEKEREKLPKSYINYDVQPGNMIYHKITYSQGWFLAALLCHVGQFTFLLVLGTRTVPLPILYFLTGLAVIVTLLIALSRWFVHRKPRKFELWSKNEMTPEQETDDVPPITIYCLVTAALLEGFIFAVYAVFSSGVIGTLDQSGFFTSDTTLQALRFGSVTILAIHRIVRPANRVDPMRTFMELEVVSVCWDALDGSTIAQLIDGRNLDTNTLIASQFLLVFWYLSVGVRMATMISVMLPPTDLLYRMITFQPFQLAAQPTVDRTMQGLRLRCTVILIMTVAELYAAGLRITCWAEGLLDSLQQDMALKNILFLSSVYSAYSMYNNTVKRDWNDREIAFGILLPKRPTQLRIFRWLFVISYLVQGALMSAVLANVSSNSKPWAANVVFDVIFAVIFLLYCGNTHIQNPDTSHNRFLWPRKSFVLFPAKMAFIISTLMMINLYSARIPAIYYHANDMSTANNGSLNTYNSALLIVNFSIVVIGSLSMYWSIAFMLFKKEFTASPGNYNAIHDPTISMVSMSIQIEAALDVLSCTTFMAVATYGLPASVNAGCAMFSLLELFNAYQSFGLQIILSGGHDDTPADLVKWKAVLRSFRFLVDFGCLILRVDLWVQYSALSSVFLIKNLYNLLNTVAQVERSYGIDRYPQSTIFMEFVPPSDWYAMTKEQWRTATRTDGAQSSILARSQS